MSETTIPPGRGGALYEVTCLRAGVDARTASQADFFTVTVQAPTELAARLAVRNSRSDVAHAFDAKKVKHEIAKHDHVAIIGDKRIPTSAKVVEHYERAFKKSPVQFEPIDPEASLKVRE